MHTRLGLMPAVVMLALLTACTPNPNEEGVSESPPTQPQQTPASQPAGTETTPALDCSRPERTPVSGTPVVPEGASAARLCGGWADNGGFDLAWPTDTLTDTATERLVRRLNKLKPYKQPNGCTLPASPPFDLVLQYPDGSRVWLHGDTAGSCANITVRGGQKWTGADQILRYTRTLITGQRAYDSDSTPERPIEPDTCPESWQDVAATEGSVQVIAGDPAVVTACRYRLDPRRPDRITQSLNGTLLAHTPISHPDRFIRLISNGSRVDPCNGVAYDLTRTQDVLLIRDQHGDIHSISTTACWPNQLDGKRRYPSTDFRQTVAETIDQSRS